MASVDVNITIDLPDGVDFESYITQIQSQITQITGLETKINIREVDDPLSLSPISVGKLKE